ncbi:phosphotransferase [Aurantivibrio plasticivorans]
MCSMASDSVVTDMLTAWVEAQLPALSDLHITLPEAPIELVPLSGDAGARCYFTLPKIPSLLAVYAPIDSEDSQQFVAIANYIREQGIHAPQIYAVDFTQGFLLIEHMGDQLFLAELTQDNVEVLYGEAMLALLNMQQSARNLDTLEDYSSEKLLAEMSLFPEWFVGGLLGKTLSDGEKRQLDDVFSKIVGSALEQPTCFVHRDFHSRNLIHRKVGQPGVIDFQDGVWGPFTYDLVSLLRDCYVRWPAERVNHWLMTYANMAMDVGIIGTTSPEQLQRWFDWMGLQRHIKVLGIFARLHLRDKKPRYLTDLPLVIRYTLEVAERYPELAEFHQWFCDVLLPQCKAQTWYSNYQLAGYTPA